jgi:hypothetical protein
LAKYTILPSGLGGPEDYFCRTTTQRQAINDAILAANPRPTGIYVMLDHENCNPYDSGVLIGAGTLARFPDVNTPTELVNETKMTEWYNDINELDDRRSAGTRDLRRQEQEQALYGRSLVGSEQRRDAGLGQGHELPQLRQQLPVVPPRDWGELQDWRHQTRHAAIEHRVLALLRGLFHGRIGRPGCRSHEWARLQRRVASGSAERL